MIDGKVYKYRLSLYIQSQSAESGPPLGTILGNLGVNAVKFCKDFNEFTKDLPDYIILRVVIYIYTDRNFTFQVFEPSLNHLLSLLIKEDIINNKFYIDYSDLVKLAIFKFPDLILSNSISLIYSILKVRKIIVYDKVQ